jgi:peptide/nickel transport system substrate-binding protein
MYLPNSDPVRVRLGKAISERLKGFGIVCKVTEDEPQVFVKRADPPFDYDAVLLGWVVPDSADLFEILHSSSVPYVDWSTVKISGGENIMQYKDRAVDQALEAFRQAGTVQARVDAAKRVIRLIDENVPFAPLYAHRGVIFARKGLKAGNVSPFDLFYDVVQWSKVPAAP